MKPANHQNKQTHAGRSCRRLLLLLFGSLRSDISLCVKGSLIGRLLPHVRCFLMQSP
jgi:hypothetical protein